MVFPPGAQLKTNDIINPINDSYYLQTLHFMLKNPHFFFRTRNSLILFHSNDKILCVNYAIQSTISNFSVVSDWLVLSMRTKVILDSLSTGLNSYILEA